MKIAALQLDIAWEDRRANYAKVARFAENAAAAGAVLLVLPEMFATGFSMNPKVTAEDPDGDTARFLRELAQRHGMAVLGGLVLKGREGKGRNTALTISRDGKDLARYTKTHLFSFMDEHEYHEAGDGPELFEFEGQSCACFICYDLRFPELFRSVADVAGIIFVIASWPEARQHHWDVLLRARAIENQCYVVGVNRTGRGGDLTFTGGSAIIDPLGRYLTKESSEEALLIADLDTALVKEVRAAMPFLKDRRG